jgi:hypothetical protein
MMRFGNFSFNIICLLIIQKMAQEISTCSNLAAYFLVIFRSPVGQMQTCCVLGNSMKLCWKIIWLRPLYVRSHGKNNIHSPRFLFVAQWCLQSDILLCLNTITGNMLSISQAYYYHLEQFFWATATDYICFVCCSSLPASILLLIRRFSLKKPFALTMMQQVNFSCQNMR